MRENRTYGSEGGGTETNRLSLPLLQQWLRDNLATTLTSKRSTAYQEFAKSPG